MQVNHLKVNNLADWTQPELDAQIVLGNYPTGTLLADITLPSDWDENHVVVLGADENFVTDAQLVIIGNTTGTNTGDNATNTQYSGLAASKAEVAGATTQAFAALRLEVGHASDTSIERVSAGVASVEGKNIITRFASVAVTGQVADITTANLATVAGTYRISYVMEDTVADLAAGILTITFAGTDDAGAATYTDTQTLTVVGRKMGTVIMQIASGNLTYATSHTGIFGNSAYSLYLTVEKLQ